MFNHLYLKTMHVQLVTTHQMTLFWFGIFNTRWHYPITFLKLKSLKPTSLAKT
jgi:hypothetical protein